MLSVRRKKDREEMASEIIRLATELGVACEREDIGSREIVLHLTGPRGLRVTVDLDGTSSQPNLHVVAWCIDFRSNAHFADSFGDVNPVHRRKATAVVYSFVGLLAELRRGFTLAKTGDAFLQPAETAQAAE